MKFDLHCHTLEGSLDGKVSITEYVSTLKALGFDGMLVTDHNSHQAYCYYKEHHNDAVFQDFTVLRGIEYDTLDAGHFLLILPESADTALFELRGMSLPLLVEMVHKYGGILGPAHPFGEKFLSFGRSRYFRKQRDIVRNFDFLEAFNACESAEDNQKAKDLADQYQLVCFGGSDSHNLDNIGLAHTDFPMDIKTTDDLIQYVKDKKETSYGGNRYYGTIKNHLGKWNDFLVYGYFFYNKFAALWRFPKRQKTLHSIQNTKMS